MMKLKQKVIKYRRSRECHNHKTNLSIKHGMSMPSICFFKLKSLKESHQKMLRGAHAEVFHRELVAALCVGSFTENLRLFD